MDKLCQNDSQNIIKRVYNFEHTVYIVQIQSKVFPIVSLQVTF